MNIKYSCDLISRNEAFPSILDGVLNSCELLHFRSLRTPGQAQYRQLSHVHVPSFTCEYRLISWLSSLLKLPVARTGSAAFILSTMNVASKPSVLQPQNGPDESEPPLAPTTSKVQFHGPPMCRTASVGQSANSPGQGCLPQDSKSRSFSLVGKSFKGSSVAARQHSNVLISATSTVIDPCLGRAESPQARSAGACPPHSSSFPERTQVIRKQQLTMKAQQGYLYEAKILTNPSFFPAEFLPSSYAFAES